MSTFVLVAGAWIGEWAWEQVTDQLENLGHTVYPRSLPGLAERIGESRPSIGIADYVSDVRSFIEAGDLSEVILVGHSFGGAVVGGVSRVIPTRLSQVVYVDTGPMPDGAAYVDFLRPDQREFIDKLIAIRGEGWKIPKPSWSEMAQSFQASIEGLDQDQLDKFDRRATPQPARTWTDPLKVGELAGFETLPKTSITCSFPLAQLQAVIASGHPWFTPMAGPEWRFVELPTGHWPMFSRPKDLARALDEVASDAHRTAARRPAPTRVSARAASNSPT